MVLWESKVKWDTELNADSVEWCPVEPYTHVLVCGTYQLEKTDQDAPTTKQTRHGRIYLFTIKNTAQELTPIQTIETSGILDQKWSYHLVQGYPTLAVVTSEGVLQLFKLIDGDNFKLEHWMEHVIGRDVLALSVDWSTNKNAGESRLIVSDSSGGVTILKIGVNNMEVISSCKSHSLEAWIGAFNYWNPDLYYSGADDCLFKSYDMRVGDTSITTNKSHQAGVTAIRKHLQEEHELLTGSYDETVRVWDTRNLKRFTSEVGVNGGVWRLKWHPYKHNTVLVACMYGGFRILHVGDNLEILSEFLEHESIAYGADWKFDQSSMIATCSFYDSKLCISEVTW